MIHHTRIQRTASAGEKIVKIKISISVVGYFGRARSETEKASEPTAKLYSFEFIFDLKRIVEPCEFVDVTPIEPLN